MLENKKIDNNSALTETRICPICQLPLKMEDFKGQYGEKYSTLWDNKKVGIPCCRCYKLLEQLSTSKRLEIDFPCEIDQVAVILNNLVKFGFIDQQMSDTEFEEYSEYIKDLKKRKILRYFFT